jgi:hypothetical protein
MTSIWLIPLTYCELFAEPASDPFGVEADLPAEYIKAVYLNLRTACEAPEVDKVEDELISDFSHTISGVGIFEQTNRPPTGILEILHGFQKFPGVPGKIGQLRKQLFCYVGDAMGVDL